MRRRTLAIVAMGALLLALTAGMALAATVVNCTTNPCVGTEDADEMLGRQVADTIKALGGHDWVKANEGADKIYGGYGDDDIEGGSGKDRIYGGPDGDGFSDTGPGLRGGADSDKIYGEGAPDIIDASTHDAPQEFTTAPVDYSYGGDDNDTIFAIDGNKDVVNCGKGTDSVFYDDNATVQDKVKNCEFKHPF